MLDIVLMGLMYGLTLSALALGLSLIFGVTKILNIAQGEFYMLGAFVLLAFTEVVRVDFWVALIAASIVVGIVAVPFEAGIRSYYGKEPLYALILTLGYSFVLRDAAYSVSRTTMLSPVAAGFYAIDPPVKGGFEVYGMTLPYYRFVVLGIICVAYLALWLLVRNTRQGRYMRAVTQNAELLATSGVDVRRTYTLTFAISAGLAAMAGALMGPITTVYSDMGHEMILLAFIAVIVGGLGNIRATLAASIILSEIFVFLSLELEPYWSQTILGLISMVALYVTARRT